MSKKVKKKIKIKWGPFFILCFALLSLYFCYELLISFRITNIYVEGNNILKDWEIIELAGISDYPSFLETTKQSIEKNLNKSPIIIDTSVKKKLFGEVILKIEEAIPLFINSEGWVVLSNKKEIENDRNLILMTLLNYTPDTKYEKLIEELTNTIEDVRLKISEIKYEPTERDKDRFLLLMDDGNEVYLTLTKFERINYYDNILEELNLECQKGILNLDSGNHFELKEKIC